MQNMASILSLNDDCLLIIVSYLRDPRTFYSVALTCKRFLQATKHTKSVLHPNLLRRKAEYYTKRYIVDVSYSGDKRLYHRFDKIKVLLHEAVKITEGRDILSYDKVINVWRTSGPVATKLFTWIRKNECSVEDGEPRATCRTKYRTVTLYLPKCKKTLVIKTTYFRDYIGNYDPELSIHAECGDLNAKSEGFTKYLPEDYMFWEEDDLSHAVQPMKAVIDLLQTELGDTIPSIPDRFFIWLCYFFPDEQNLDGDIDVRFKDPTRNVEPTPDVVKTLCIERLLQDQQGNTRFQNVVSKWKNDESQESAYSKVTGETIDLLVQRSETNILQCLQRDLLRISEIASSFGLNKLPKQLMLELILRTSLEESQYSPGAVSDKCIESTVFFRCIEGKLIKVCGLMHGDGASYPTWDGLDLKFTLPDERMVELHAERSYRNIPLQIKDLSPVTELLQQCVNHSSHSEKVPQVTNIITAAYFLRALEFSEVLETFLGEDFESMIEDQRVEGLRKLTSLTETSSEESD